MGRFLNGVLVSALAAGTAVYIYAQRRSAATGRDVGEVISNLPQELKESGGSLKHHMEEAAAAGRKAASARENEIERELNGEEEDQIQIREFVV